MSAATSSVRGAAVFAAACVAVVVAASSATVSAHTDFDYSLPTDGASVGEPVSQITVAFTEPVTLVGPGFEVLDPEGNVVQPFAVTDDDRAFRLQLDPALGGGDVGVRWEVAAEDGHVLSGSFSFFVAADAPAPTTASTTAPPPTAVPATTSIQSTTQQVTTQPVTTQPATTSTPPSVEAIVAETTSDSGSFAGGSGDDLVAAAGAEAAGAEAVGVGEPNGNDGSRGLYLTIAVAIAAGSGAFLFARSRRV